MGPLRISFCFVLLLALPTQGWAKEKRAKEGIVLSMVAGDVACYVEFKDAKNKWHSTMANFEICEATYLLNQKASFTYDRAKVLAGKCEGNPDCPHT